MVGWTKKELVNMQIKGGFSDQFYDQLHLTNHTVAKIIWLFSHASQVDYAKLISMQDKQVVNHRFHRMWAQKLSLNFALNSSI